MADNDLCRREGIKPDNYCAWTKEFMEAGLEPEASETEIRTGCDGHITPLGQGQRIASVAGALVMIFKDRCDANDVYAGPFQKQCQCAEIVNVAANVCVKMYGG